MARDVRIDQASRAVVLGWKSSEDGLLLRVHGETDEIASSVGAAEATGSSTSNRTPNTPASSSCAITVGIAEPSRWKESARRPG